MSHRRFELHRDTDVTGISGTGIVAEGIAFTDGVVALRWRSEWPTSVVVHDRGIEAVHAVHGHHGSTRVVWLDEPEAAVAELDPQRVWVLAKIPVESEAWLTERRSTGWRVSVMSQMNDDDMDTAVAREFAAQYLAAADEADRRNGQAEVAP